MTHMLMMVKAVLFMIDHGFTKMLDDVEAGHINLVIVKDLSRFGRVASGIDDYIEEYFQMKGVRFIAVNENLDSKTSSNFQDDIKIRAFFNEWFLRDCSKKTKDGKHTKALQGKVMCTYAKYGYQKDPQDKNHLIPNPETSWVVQKIFEMLTTKLPVEVAQWLIDNNVPVPSESVGNKHTRTVNEVKRLWNRTTVVRIARDRTYLGEVINGKSRKVSYKSKKIMQVPKEEQIVIAGQHEPLVDKEIFDIVQQMIDSRQRTRKHKYDFLLKGLLECAECGKKLSVLPSTNEAKKAKNKGLPIEKKQGRGRPRKEPKTVLYTRCNTYASMTRQKLCTPHSNSLEKLTNEVLETVKARLQQYLDEDALYKVAENIKNRQQYKKNMIQNQIATLKNKLSLDEKKIEQLYEDKLNGILQVEDFERMYLATLEDKKQIKASIEELENQKYDTDDEMKLKELVNKFMSMKEITREILVLLIDRITVSEDKNITIYYKFSVLNDRANNTDKIINLPYEQCS